MKLSIDLVGLDSLARRLANLGETVVAPTVEAATDALAQEAERSREVSGATAPLVRAGTSRRRTLGVADPAAVARELGTLDQPPAPWLAPALPAARGSMRAAVRTRVRDLVAAHAGKHKRPVARAISGQK